MPTILVIEDGSVVTDANTYCSLTFANDYHTLMGNTDWVGDDAALELALVQATQALDLLYGSKYSSARLETSVDQSLQWPRYGFYDQNGVYRTTNTIPLELKRAEAELALLLLTEAALPMPEENERTMISEKSEKVGEIAVSYKYRAPLDVASFEGYRKVDLLLKPITRPKVTNIRLSR